MSRRALPTRRSRACTSWCVCIPSGGGVEQLELAGPGVVSTCPDGNKSPPQLPQAKGARFTRTGPSTRQSRSWERHDSDQHPISRGAKIHLFHETTQKANEHFIMGCPGGNQVDSLNPLSPRVVSASDGCVKASSLKVRPHFQSSMDQAPFGRTQQLSDTSATWVGSQN